MNVLKYTDMFFTNRNVFLIKFIWVAICIILLFTTLFYYDGSGNSDIEIFLVYSMSVLSFPMGFLLSMFLLFIIYGFLWGFNLLSYSPGVCYILLTIEWLWLFVIGFFQWFILMPILWRKLRIH